MAPSITSLGLFGLLVGLIAMGLFHGVHLEVEWKPADFEGLRGVAAVHKGHYKDVLNVIQNVSSVLVYDKIISMDESNTVSTFGIYYDDPLVVKDPKFWRSRGGVILNESTTSTVKNTNNYKKIHVRGQKCITAEFPLVSQLSIFLGLFKVYPKLSAYEDKTKESHGAIIELYDFANKRIRYIALEKDSEDNKF